MNIGNVNNLQAPSHQQIEIIVIASKGFLAAAVAFGQVCTCIIAQAEVMSYILVLCRMQNVKVLLLVFHVLLQTIPGDNRCAHANLLSCLPANRGFLV